MMADMRMHDKISELEAMSNRTSSQEKELKNTGKAIGLDLGIKSFLTDSDGNKVANPKFYDKYLLKVRKIQQRLSNKTKGSANYSKARRCLARIHEKICNNRDDFLHKLSSSIINDNQVIIMEDLGIKDMLQKSHRNLARNIGDVSWSRFVEMMKYKAEWRGKMLVQIGRYEPTSKRCSACEAIYEKLRLEEREWICDKCGTKHDRDYNAAKNVLHVGLEQPDIKALRLKADRKPTGSSCG